MKWRVTVTPSVKLRYDVIYLIHYYETSVLFSQLFASQNFGDYTDTFTFVSFWYEAFISSTLPSVYRVYPSNKQKQNWKIDTSLVAIGAQNLFFSLYKLGVNFLWIREILKMYISPSFSNRKKVQYYRFCIFKGVSKLDLLHSTGHKSLKNGSKSNNLGSLIKFRKFLAR